MNEPVKLCCSCKNFLQGKDPMSGICSLDNENYTSMTMCQHLKEQNNQSNTTPK